MRGIVVECFDCQDSASEATAKQLALHDHELACLRDEQVLWQQQTDLLTALRADGEKARQKAEQELEKAQSVAAKKLASAGITLETMQAWPTNPKAARAQFDHQLDVVPAVRDAKVHFNTLQQFVRQLPAFESTCQEAIDILNEDILAKLASVLGKPVPPQRVGK